MNVQDAIEVLTQEEDTEAVLVLELAVKPLCYTNTAGLAKWLALGEFDKTATPARLAILWDQRDDFW